MVSKSQKVQKLEDDNRANAELLLQILRGEVEISKMRSKDIKPRCTFRGHSNTI
jgi:hypothetical protein